MSAELLQGTKIWLGDVNAVDSYVDFKGVFAMAGKGKRGKKVLLRISCDSNYSAYINGKLVGFAQCADYPHYRNYDEIDVTGFCRKDKNVFTATVWHYGVDSQTYVNADAYLLFDIVCDGETLLKSDKTIGARVNARYLNGYAKTITPQLGISFLYNANEKCGGFESSEEHGFGEAHKRERGICKMKARGAKAEVKKTKGGYLVDFKKETVGFLTFDFKSETEQKITVSYGERLLPDGNVQRFLEGRDFSAEYVAKKGENRYVNTFRRIAGRYLFVETENPIDWGYIGVREVYYPVDEIRRKFADPLLQKIYDVSVYTVRCCMHEHYEDCPWREQALYAMDSRNQMLCNYYTYKKTIYQRENLVLMSKGLREDGLLSLCFPTGVDYPIPFFSLAYIMQTYEYVKYTGDKTLLDETGETLDKIMSVFLSRIDDNRLIAQLPAPYWNFYEWAEDSANADQLSKAPRDHLPKVYDLTLNCMFIYAAKMYNELRGKNIETDGMKKAVRETLYVPGKDAFRLSNLSEKMSVLGNSLAVLAGVGDEKTVDAIVRGDGMIPVTLSMNAFKYDSLLLFGDKYKQYIIDDIKTKYKKMLDDGATTFWETELGADDFGGAGSLCHGWSAIPIYYLSVLAENKIVG